MSQQTFQMIIKWDDLYDPDKFYQIRRDIKLANILECIPDVSSKSTVLNAIYEKSRDSENKFELIPNEISVDSKSFSFQILKIFEIDDFPSIKRTIFQNIPYLKEWLEIEDPRVTIRYFENISKTESDIGKITDIINNAKMVKELFNNEINKTILSIFVFGAFVKKFYQPDKQFFNVNNIQRILFKIYPHINEITAVLENMHEKLDNYDIESNNTNYKILKGSKLMCGSIFKSFWFFENKILNTCYFNMYRQNLDLKFLSYISTTSRMSA